MKCVPTGFRAEFLYLGDVLEIIMRISIKNGCTFPDGSE